MHVCPRLLFPALLVAAAAAGITALAQGGGQQPSFRSGVTAVPVDVTVLGKDGRPITDLKREDFTILEDGVLQAIAHFAAQLLVAETPGAALRATAGGAGAFDASPQTQRVFLIVLGARALGDVRRHPDTIDALIRFVRERLLPQDQVAVLAAPRMDNDYNRATGFTSDHERVVQFLEGFRGTRVPFPPALGKAEPPDTTGAGRAVFTPAGVLEKSPDIKADLGFEDYVKAWGRQSLGLDVDFVLYALKYLRYMSGQKHLVFVAERGFEVPVYRDLSWHNEVLWEDVKRVTSLAADARVALDTIQIGQRVGASPSLLTAPPPPAAAGGEPAPATQASTAEKSAARAEAAGGSRVETGSPSAAVFSSPAGSAVFIDAAAAAGLPRDPYDLRYVARQTGGQASMLKDADEALARIDTSTRGVHYLLAYYPSNADWNGKYRSVEVRVNRPGATVLFRHGYYARREPDVFDRRRIVSGSRMDAAGYQLSDIRDIDLKFVPSFTKSATGRGGEVFVPLSIDVSRLGWSIAEDTRHVVRLDLAIYCGDSGGKIVGSSRRLLNLALTDESYERAMKERFSRDMRVTVGSKPTFVKVIVYDYDGDLVGSAMVKIPK